MPSQLCCAVCSWRGWLKKALQDRTAAHLGQILLLALRDDAGFWILTLKRPLVVMYGQLSLPLMVLGLAVMGFAVVDPFGCDVADYGASKSRRDRRINRYLYAAFRAIANLSGGVIA
ncbi:hypothetical protein ACNKHN_03275 [Shigella flexneri]